MLNFTSRTSFFICSIPTDMRKGREGLATIVREYFHRDPLAYDEAFIFYNKKYDTVKILHIIRKTKCFRIWERNAIISKTKRNFSSLYPTPQNFKKIDRLRRNEIHLKAVRTPSELPSFVLSLRSTL